MATSRRSPRPREKIPRPRPSDYWERRTAAEKARNNKRKALYSTTYSSDPDTITAFNASGAPKNCAHVFALSVDRKNLANSLVVSFPGNPVEADRRGKLVDSSALLAFVRDT